MTEARMAPETGAKETESAAAKAVAGWVNQLARTIKTCRLYDVSNPTVVRFREDLAMALSRLLDEQGTVTLRFSDEDVLFEEQSIHPARSRDDNLALAFHRDGIRSVTFSPGITQAEVAKLLDAILQVTGQNIGQDDLVTLLWEAHMPHIAVDYVPSDGDIGSTESQESEESRVPWPTGQAEGEPSGADAATAATETQGTKPTSRSDDWTTDEYTAEIEAGFATLDALSTIEVRRFLEEFQAEHEVSPTTTALAIVRATLGADVGNASDREELADFTPRLLRLSVGRGDWLEAHEAMNLLLEAGREAEISSLVQELLQPITVGTVVEHLDQQDAGQVANFIDFAKSLGEACVDLLGAALAESQQRRNRRMLAETIADLCREAPERLAPWLADRRWYVVRNMIQILDRIGGDSIVGLLRSVVNHPEPRVRQEAIVAIGRANPGLARPILLKLLGGGDSRTFCTALHQLSTTRDPATARLLLTYLLDPKFEQRIPEERRALYAALSAVGGDEVVPELEAELMKGNWFARGQEAHRQAVARVLARIGTTAARNALQRGALSKRPPVRKACEDAIAGAPASE